MTREIPVVGVGATTALTLRVSVAALARVLLDDPESGRTLLVLERAVTLMEGDGEPEIVVRAKPYGGGVRVRDVDALRRGIGEFRFDSERSRTEADFRILIREADWPRVLEFCVLHLRRDEDGLLETSPARELAEEFEDALRINLSRLAQPGMNPGDPQWTLKSMGVVVEAAPTPTTSPRAPGAPTVRVYSIHEARLHAPALIEAVLVNSRANPRDEDLRRLALADARNGGRGRANAALALPLDWLVREYDKIPIKERGTPVRIGGHLLDGNVPAILPEVETAKYRR